MSGGAAQAIKEKLTAKKSVELSAGVFATLADEIEAALGSPFREKVETLQADLDIVVGNLMSAAPVSVRTAVRGDLAASPEILAAYDLGQVSFAQNMVARVAATRIDDRFCAIIKAPMFEKYVRAMIDQERSNREIGQLLGKDDADVSRRMKTLRQYGIAETRRDGVRSVNFLTIPARAFVESLNIAPIETMPGDGKKGWAVSLVSNLPLHLRTSPVLNVKPHSENAA